MIECTYDIKIRRYRFDQELYKNDKIKTWLRNIGVSPEPSSAYHHWQNGVAERNMRTMREKSSAMIQGNNVGGRIKKIIAKRSEEMMRETSLPAFLWPEAVRQAVWLKNRSPAKAHRYKKTPWEALYALKPDLKREQIWGSRSYVTKAREMRMAAELTKLHTPRATVGYFVGSESESI